MLRINARFGLWLDLSHQLLSEIRRERRPRPHQTPPLPSRTTNLAVGHEYLNTSRFPAAVLTLFPGRCHLISVPLSKRRLQTRPSILVLVSDCYRRSLDLVDPHSEEYAETLLWAGMRSSWLSSGLLHCSPSTVALNTQEAHVLTTSLGSAFRPKFRDCWVGKRLLASPRGFGM